jgi:mRNA interferase RelE/StbE
LDEWHKLDASLREPLKKKLNERLKNPRLASSALSGMPDCYKIKLRSAGYRLVYRVDDEVVFVTVIAVGKRDKQKVYEAAQSRISSEP